MIFDLKAGTDAAICAIFDPLAVAHLLHQSWEQIDALTGCDEGVLEQNEAQGNLITYSIASDGTFAFRFFVEEAPPGELLDSTVSSFRDALLRVPSGILIATGYEYLPHNECGFRSIEDFQPGKLGEKHSIPAGNYSVSGYNLATEIFSPTPHAIFVMRRLPRGADLNGMRGAGLGLV